MTATCLDCLRASDRDLEEYGLSTPKPIPRPSDLCIKEREDLGFKPILPPDTIRLHMGLRTMYEEETGHSKEDVMERIRLKFDTN